MSGWLAPLVIVLACVTSTHAEPLAAVHEVAFTLDARLNIDLQPALLPSVGAEAGGGQLNVVSGGADSTAPGTAPVGVPLPGEAAPISQAKTCLGVPVTSSYTAGWSCSATDCTATCVPGAKTPYGPSTAVCDAAGNWVVQVSPPGAAQPFLLSNQQHACRMHSSTDAVWAAHACLCRLIPLACSWMC